MSNKDEYKKCCLNCKHWGVESGVFWNNKGYCYRKQGAYTGASFKCGHFEYAEPLLKEMEEVNANI